MEKALPAFSMKSLQGLSKGEVHCFASPRKGHPGQIKILLTDTLAIVEGIVATDGPTQPLTHFNDRPSVEMNFMLEGNIRQSYEGLLNGYHYRKGYHNILFNPLKMETNELMTSGVHRLLGVHMSPEKMSGLFYDYLPELQPYCEKIEKGEPFVLHAPGNSISSRLKYILNTIWDCPYPAGLGKLYFESRILELLSWQCEMLIGAVPRQEQIASKDLEKIYHAKELLLNDLSNPPSLKELSKSSGLNEFKLKKYFRQVFNRSIYNFLCEERLQKARQMIYEGEKNITDIAHELGYAHPQHFHRAFKKQFGVTPKSLLK